MRNGESVRWWMLGIYLIFFVTSGVLAQAVPSETDTVSDDSGVDTASDDSALSQVQMMRIMDEIHEVEIRLRDQIDQISSEGKKERATLQKIENETRAHIDQKYSELNTEISALGEIRLRDYMNEKYLEHNRKIAALSKDVAALSKDVKELTTKANSLQTLIYIVCGLALGAFIPALEWWWELRTFFKRIARFLGQSKPPDASI